MKKSARSDEVRIIPVPFAGEVKPGDALAKAAKSADLAKVR